MSISALIFFFTWTVICYPPFPPFSFFLIQFLSFHPSSSSTHLLLFLPRHSNVICAPLCCDPFVSRHTCNIHGSPLKKTHTFTAGQKNRPRLSKHEISNCEYKTTIHGKSRLHLLLAKWPLYPKTPTVLNPRTPLLQSLWRLTPRGKEILFGANSELLNVRQRGYEVIRKKRFKTQRNMEEKHQQERKKCRMHGEWKQMKLQT